MARAIKKRSVRLDVRLSEVEALSHELVLRQPLGSPQVAVGS